ncbi:MAG TPA: DUF4870 domain-containing protein [Roseiflexaceae bacterium]|nr:DUF4870 domain-containing protein [Roseiflexaceae bacterium]HMP42734.1 DUF4870 domain-containing protein [Roseiflexaceae bacterium]
MRPSQDERILAALAHAGILINSFNLIGMIAAAVIWTTQREKSAFVRGHAIQSVIYQLVVLLLIILLLVLWSGCLFLSLLPAILRPDLYRDGSPPNLFWLALLFAIVPIGFMLISTCYAIYGAVAAYRGNEFRYILAGRIAGSPTPAPAMAVAAITAAAETHEAPVAGTDPAPAASAAPPAAAAAEGNLPTADVQSAANDPTPDAAEVAADPAPTEAKPASRRRARRQADPDSDE